MIAIAPAKLIAELEDAIKGGSPERRVQMLRRIMGLFLSNADRFNEQQIGVFDDVFVRLIESLDPRTLAKLSTTLCGLMSAPKEAVRRLASHKEASVAVPLLTHAKSLSEKDLIEIAGVGGQEHLLAISGRRALNEALTDALLKRCDTSVCRVLARHDGARFSDRGFSTLVATAQRDDDIADSLVVRPDLPVKMLRELVTNANKAGQARLLKVALPETRETIQASIDSLATRACAKIREPIDYSAAKSSVLELNLTGGLNDAVVNRFAVRGEYKNVVAALSLLAEVTIETIETLMVENDRCGLIIACRASRLDWQTTLAIINNRSGAQHMSQQERERAQEAFETLPLSVAQRTIRFGSAGNFAMKPALTQGALALAGAG